MSPFRFAFATIMTGSIRWQHFDSATLAAAATADRPVLMVLTVPWCQHCRELMATTFADPQIVAKVNDDFVPVHIDAERRPDVNQRYGTGAWPTIAWLTPGGELITHQNFLDAEALSSQLDRVRAAWRDRRGDIERGVADIVANASHAEAPIRTKLRRQMTEDVASAIYEKFDHRHGGFGETSKFPHPEALDFALVQAQKRGDERMREVVTLTLDRMMQSPLHDHVDGGFFRFSQTPDWHTPNYEKLLDQNALVLRAYLEAYQVFDNEAYRRAAEGIVEWMLTTMREPGSGAFAGSQNGDMDYFAGGGSERSHRPPPLLDRTVYCHANAIAVSSLLKASAVLSQPHWREHAMATLGFLLDNLYDGREVYHYWDGTYHLPGMLADQACLIRALIDASQHTGDSDLLQPAEAIADRAIERQKSKTGGFYDILHDPGNAGSMRRRNRSILDNATMAESLMRLSYLARRPELFAEAISALESFASDYREYGYYVAGYGRAVDLVFYEPLFVTIVGDRDDGRAVQLRRAALSTYVPSRIVQSLDPDRDPVLLERSGLEIRDYPIAYLAIGSTVQSVAGDDAELLEAMAKLQSERRAKLRRPN
ncbi:MAG: thioredoxin domain-containing protein [Planctomycetes bacterium]|nr:thioredoxin domain-containing protein [Planctomycetota bacterium]